jgi:hypothetical protein
MRNREIIKYQNGSRWIGVAVHMPVFLGNEKTNAERGYSASHDLCMVSRREQ